MNIETAKTTRFKIGVKGAGATSLDSRFQVQTPADNSRSYRRLLGVAVYAMAMGLLEAVCVIYLRRLIVPAGVDVSHPVVPIHRLHVEIIREACTIIMLIAVAWLAGSSMRQRVAYFLLVFGVWDIFYYVGLKWLADWPSSWLEWDCLFLIPKPWYGPVLAPVLISGYFAIACSWLLVREGSLARLRLSPVCISLQLLAGAVWYWSFVKESKHIAAKGYAGVDYSWWLLACGLAVGVIGLWFAVRRQTKADSSAQMGGSRFSISGRDARIQFSPPPDVASASEQQEVKRM